MRRGRRAPSDVRQLVLRPDGMFSNVNEVVEQLRRAERDGYRFLIDWSRSAYRDPDRLDDPWAYYFQPCFTIDEADLPPGDVPQVLGGEPVACSADNIITPRLADGVCAPLLLPRDRLGAAQLIARHIRLQEVVRTQIDAFAAEHFHGAIVGLHIRGPGRVDGGVPGMRRALDPSQRVPVECFFDAVDQAVADRPRARIFACSDSLAVLRAVIDRYGPRVVTWPAVRSEFGEMHAGHPANGGAAFPRFRLGLDVVAEAWLLARTGWFVHGNSNVANFVLCLRPDLSHTYVPA